MAASVSQGDDDEDMSDAVQFSSASSMPSSSSAASSMPAVVAGPPTEFRTTTTFVSLGLSPLTQRALNEDFKYATMSIVQAACIPIALQGKDIVAKAKTGTGTKKSLHDLRVFALRCFFFG